ncbi:MAG: hypothetical protein V2A70_09535 [Candidatus Omnitrophota bacterium]
MTNLEQAKLLGDPEVVREIERYKWIESEKAGLDVGFDKAAEEWLASYAKDWMKFHLPSAKKITQSAKRVI